MPNVLTHTLIADRTLEHWNARGSAPFDGADPRCRAAFVHGALGPDLGYFPHADTFFSEVVHRLRTGRMAARLLECARGAEEIAFACGWATHLIADARIHPTVDAEAMRLTRVEAREPRPGSHDPFLLPHIRIEVGLDAVLLDRHPSIGRRLPPVFEARGLRFLAHAFRDVYGLELPAEELHAAHRSVVSWHRCLVPLIRWMTADWSDSEIGAGRLVAPLLRAREASWVRYVGAGPVAAAFVSPTRPTIDLCERIEREMRLIPALVDEAVRAPSSLPDMDMEDGRLICEELLKPAARRTLQELERRARATRVRRRDYSATPRKPMTKAPVMSAMRSMPYAAAAPRS